MYYIRSIVLEYRKDTMGCKFSITVDQQKPKTPSWLSQRKSLQKDSTDQTIQTQESEEAEETKDDDDDEDLPPDAMSSPDQVEIKSLKKTQRRAPISRWKP